VDIFTDLFSRHPLFHFLPKCYSNARAIILSLN
jgi:hypothetical protein